MVATGVSALARLVLLSRMIQVIQKYSFAARFSIN
jgi:hypothetical protein